MNKQSQRTRKINYVYYEDDHFFLLFLVFYDFMCWKVHKIFFHLTPLSLLFAFGSFGFVIMTFYFKTAATAADDWAERDKWKLTPRFLTCAFSDRDCSCGFRALFKPDLQEGQRNAYAPSVPRSTSFPGPNTDVPSKEAKDLKGPYLLVPGKSYASCWLTFDVNNCHYINP